MCHTHPLPRKSGSARNCIWYTVKKTDHSCLSAYVYVNTYDFLVNFVCFIDNCFHKFDGYKHVQSSNIV